MNQTVSYEHVRKLQDIVRFYTMRNNKACSFVMLVLYILHYIEVTKKNNNCLICDLFCT